LSLSELTSRDAVLAAIREHDQLGPEQFLAKYDRGPSLRYVLRYEGSDYPAKAMVYAGYAHQYPDREPLTGVRGGPASRERLEALGFDIVDIFQTSSPTIWWVNQGKSYDDEKASGHLAAPKKNKTGGAPNYYWTNLTKVRPGDIILHYAGGIRALSRATSESVDATFPVEYEKQGDQGWRVATEYFELAETIPKSPAWPSGSAGEHGPIDTDGDIKMGYLFELDSEWASRFRNAFADSWPSDSPWGTPTRKRTWVIRAWRREDYDLFGREGFVALNPGIFDRVGDVSQGDKDQISAALTAAYPDKPPSTIIARTNDLDHFVNDIAAGDNVIVPLDGGEVSHLGRVVTDYEYGSAPGRQRRDLKMLKTTGRLPEGVLRPLKAPVNIFELKDKQAIEELFGAQEGEHAVTTNDDLSELHQILSKDMVISYRLLRRFHNALAARRFVVLSGVSGTGKTLLAKKYSEAVGASTLVVPVAPNWSTNEDLLGFWNPIEGVYVDTDFSRFLRAAAESWANAQAEGTEPTAYHLILDEMNLARVEYYFAKFLSAMEECIIDGQARISMGPSDETSLNPNLYFIGTVNIDETTNSFADKVYDRAQLIEMPLEASEIKKHMGSHPWSSQLFKVWETVRPIAPFAFRVIDDIEAYANSAIATGATWQEALDEQILQKILPKIKGTDDRIGASLQALEGILEDAPLSLTKVRHLTKMLNDHGFTSFFEF